VRVSVEPELRVTPVTLITWPAAETVPVETVV
jgi:hypothetical protein